jgi:hypothetical protein
MERETFKKRFGEDHPALIKGFICSAITKAKNGKRYSLVSTKKGIVAKQIKL